MLNLIKYELIKQRRSKFLAAGFFIILEICFFIGAIFEIDSLLAFSMILLAMLSTVFIFWLGIEAIFTLAGDMKNKSGYMLFMTPHSVYKILAGKVFASIITIIAAVVCIGLIAFADLTFLLVRFNAFQELSDLTSALFSASFSIDLNWQLFGITLTGIVFSWISMVAAGFLAVTISNTLLAGKGGGTLISFILFIAISAVQSFILNGALQALDIRGEILLITVVMIISAVTTILCFLLSGECMKRYLAL